MLAEQKQTQKPENIIQKKNFLCLKTKQNTEMNEKVETSGDTGYEMKSQFQLYSFS